MKLFKILAAIILLITITGVPYFISGKKSMFTRRSLRPTKDRSDDNNEMFNRLKYHASPLKHFIKSKKLDSQICFLIDMHLPSGSNRFFVYDLQNDSVLLSGLVAHGSCDNGFQESPTFSNKANSGCSCFGKFKIGGSYTGRFGTAYKLYGFDSSNSNAYERNIVLHSYSCVPDVETRPLPICNSRGCPMVSPGFLEKLKTYIDKSSKPILLEIIN